MTSCVDSAQAKVVDKSKQTVMEENDCGRHRNIWINKDKKRGSLRIVLHSNSIHGLEAL